MNIQNLAFKINQLFLKKRVSFDYDNVLVRSKYQKMAKQMIADGFEVYIISDRTSKSGMIAIANEIGIPILNIFATGSNEDKVKQIIQLNIKEHYDSNRAVISKIPSIGKLVL